MPERKTLNEDLFYRGSSANLPRLHTCKNKTPFWDKSKVFASHFSQVSQDVTDNRNSLRFDIKLDNTTFIKEISISNNF